MEVGKIHTGLIYGSIRDGRLCDAVANWTAAAIQGFGGFSLDSIDPKALGLPAWREGHNEGELDALKQRIARADAFVIVTPEYNHGYPAALKFLIDAVHSEWRVKPVAFVSYGGISGGLRAVEQLRLVFAELHAVALRDTVSFAGAWKKFDDSARLIEAGQAEKAITVMLARLKWWATILREARRAPPFEDAWT